MSEPTFIPEPTRPQWFDAELRSFDELLRVTWHAREWAERGESAHWVVSRMVPEREMGWVQQNGLWVGKTARTRCEHVLDWPATEEDGTPRLLDRRLFDRLATMDPARRGNSRWDGFQRMCEERERQAAAEERERAEREEYDLEEAVGRAVG